MAWTVLWFYGSVKSYIIIYSLAVVCEGTQLWSKANSRRKTAVSPPESQAAAGPVSAVEGGDPEREQVFCSGISGRRNPFDLGIPATFIVFLVSGPSGLNPHGIDKKTVGAGEKLREEPKDLQVIKQ